MSQVLLSWTPLTEFDCMVFWTFFLILGDLQNGAAS